MKQAKVNPFSNSVQIGLIFKMSYYIVYRLFYTIVIKR